MPAGRPAPPLEILEEYLRECETRTVHKKWSTVEVEGIRFLVHPSLRGRKIQVLYDPLDLAYVLVCFQGRAVERAHPQPANEAALQSEAQPVLQGQRTDYLGRLRADYEARMRQELAAIQVRPAPLEQDVPGLSALLEVCRGTALSAPEAGDVAAFWQRLRPMEVDLTGRLLANARRRLGVGLHLSVYLAALEDQLVRQRSALAEASQSKTQPPSRKTTRGAKP
jgi:hypothetical protein